MVLERIKEIGWLLPRKGSDEVLGRQHCHPETRRPGRTGNMGRQNDVLQFKKPRTEFGLVFKDIETRTADGSSAERFDQGSIVHHAATGGVDENRRGFHPLQFSFPDEMMSD